MRTAQIVKHSASGIVLAGFFLALKFFQPMSVEFWLVVLAGVLLWQMVRLFAIIGQLVYEIRNDALRSLANVERALYYSNALSKEIRDLVDAEIVDGST